MIDLTGQALSAVRLDDEAKILFLTIGDGWLLAVGNDYELHAPEGVKRTLDGAEDAMVSTLAALVGHDLQSFDVRPDGGLVIGVGGLQLLVPPSPDYESWNVVGPDHVRVVSMPGGGLATWGVTGGG